MGLPAVESPSLKFTADQVQQMKDVLEAAIRKAPGQFETPYLEGALVMTRMLLNGSDANCEALLTFAQGIINR